jgi:uncharacterized membrane protein
MPNTVDLPPTSPPTVVNDGESGIPNIRTIGYAAPFRWLARGAEDMFATRFRGSFYGFLFGVMGLLIATVYETQWQLTMGMAAGFFLIGPFVCCGIYWLSRQRARGETPSLTESLTCWKASPASIGFFAAILTFLMVIWARVSVVIFALFSTASFPTLQGMVQQIFSLSNLPFVIAWFGVGFVFASLAFGISVVAVPLMLDRKTDTMMALFGSVRALWINAGPLYVWAALIVLLIGSSLMLWFIPLVITAPLVGHATWHAYRALVVDASPASGTS